MDRRGFFTSIVTAVLGSRFLPNWLRPVCKPNPFLKYNTKALALLSKKFVLSEPEFIPLPKPEGKTIQFFRYLPPNKT